MTADSRTHFFANNASAQLSVSVLDTDTTLRVQTGTGALFPDPDYGGIFKITVENVLTGDREIMNVVDRTGDIFLVERAQEGTSALNFTADVNTVVSHRLTAETLEYLASIGGASELSGLSDVVLTSVVAGQSLVFDGYEWVNETVSSGSNNNIPLNTQSGSTYTLELSDAGDCVEMTNGSANTVTVPPNSDVPFEVGVTLMVRQMGAGVTTIAAGAGVTIHTPRGLSILYQYGSVSLHQRAADEWCLEGSA